MPVRLRSLVASALAAAGLTLATSGNAQSSYKLTDLGIGEALGVNSAGAVVGFLWNPSTNVYTGFKWQSNTLTTLTPPAGYSGFIATKINSNYQIVGYWNSAAGFPYSRTAYYSAATGAVDLNSLLSPQDQAAWYLTGPGQLSDSGVVMGEGLYNGTDTSYRLDLTTTPYPTITQFAPVQPGWEQSAITGVNSAGLMCGYSINNMTRTRTGFLLSGGTFTTLPLYDANAINDAGDVAGRAYVSGIGYQAAFLPYGASSPTTCGALGYSSLPHNVNLPSNGLPKTVVGDSALKSGAACGFRWQVGGKIVDVTTLVSNLPNKKWAVTTAQAINGAGVIVGQATDGTNGHAIFLSP